MDILFITPDSSKEVYQSLADEYAAIEPSPWPLLLAGALRKDGYSVGILDPLAQRLNDHEAWVQIALDRPRFICFVVYGQNPNSGTTNMAGAVRLVTHIRDCDAYVPIIFIGSHASALPDEVLAIPGVDYVCPGDGLEALRLVLKGHKRGIVWGSPSPTADLDYAWDLVDLSLYRCHTWHNNFGPDRSPFASIYTSLGCVFKCLSGDTPINTIDGLVAIRDLVGREKVAVYTYDKETNEPVIADAINIQKTGERQQLVRVSFDDGTHIDCTPDHRFLTFKNKNQHQPLRFFETEAKDLMPGNSVKAMLLRETAHGYLTLEVGRAVKRHCRVVMEYKIGRKLKRTEQVHHLDHNKFNDHPDNLKYCASARAHFEEHPEIAERMRNNNPAKNMTPEWREKLRQSVTGKKRTAEQKERYRQSKLGKKNPNWKHGWTEGWSSRIKAPNHKVVSVTPMDESDDVYCMTVPGHGWFFANNVLVKNCDFCMINMVNKSNPSQLDASQATGMRYFDTDYILNQLEYLQSAGVKNVRIADEMFFLNKQHYEPILRGIISRGINLNLWAYARVDTVRPEFLPLFKQAGINWLCLGIESANQTIRREITKGSYETVDVRDVAREIKNAGINLLANFIFGLENDTQESMQETLDLALELNAEHTNFYPCMPLPGSPEYRRVANDTSRLPDSYSGYSFHSYDAKPSGTKHCTAGEVLAFRDRAWLSVATNDKYLSQIETKFGLNSANNIREQSKIKLRRKLLES